MMPFSSLSPAREYGGLFSVWTMAPSYVNTTDPTPVAFDGVAAIFNEVPIVARLMTEPFTNGPIGRFVAALKSINDIAEGETGGEMGDALGVATGGETGGDSGGDTGFTTGGATGGARGGATGGATGRVTGGATGVAPDDTTLKEIVKELISVPPPFLELYAVTLRMCVPTEGVQEA
jgi:hypothetical protein